MTQSKKSKPAGDKPQYVVDLEGPYGPPSQEGFGAAVFFEVADASDDLAALALKYYKYFVGDLWARWGEEAWMGPWKEVYTRKKGAKHDVANEVRGIDDPDASISVPLVLETMKDPEAAVKALSAAYDDPDVTDFRVFTIGDGGAMSGLLLAGRRENGEATFLAVLMD
jgi:hypothetical protein